LLWHAVENGWTLLVGYKPGFEAHQMLTDVGVGREIYSPVVGDFCSFEVAMRLQSKRLSAITIKNS
jgi:hypothetical protein